MNAPPRTAPAIFVWGVWTLLLAATLAFVARHGSPVPVWDDYDVLGPALGVRPVTASWLWSQHNEHRVPLPRLVLLGLDRLFGHDARAGMTFSTIVLATAAALLIGAVRRWRGSYAYSDALFPLVLLGPGHHANLLWSWQVQFTLSTALFVALVARIASRRGAVLEPGPAAGIGLTLVLLPLCGANGLALVPALGLWLLVEGGLRWARGELGEAVLIGLAALPSLLVLPLYATGYRAAGHHEAPESLGDVGRALAQFAALGWGPVAERAGTAAGAIVLALGVLAGLVLLLALRRPDAGGARIRGLFFALAAFACLAVGLAWGRAGAGERAGLEPRYVTLASPALILVYLAARAIPRPAVSELIGMALFTAACVVSWPNAEAGLAAGRDRAARFAELERDIRAGAPPSLLAVRYSPFLHPSQDVLFEWMPRLRRAGIGPFAGLRDEPPAREQALPVEPASLRLATRQGDTFTITGVDPQIAFRLPRPAFVYGIRLRYDHQGADGSPARFRLTWQQPGQGGYSPSQSCSNWALPTGRDRVTTVWIHDTIDAFSIQPDNRPCTFRLRSITLLRP